MLLFQFFIPFQNLGNLVLFLLFHLLTVLTRLRLCIFQFQIQIQPASAGYDIRDILIEFHGFGSV